MNAEYLTLRAKVAVVLLCALAALSSAGEIDSIIRAAAGRSAYPEAGALILLDRRIVTVDKNNSTTLDRYLVVKLFEDRGRDEFGEVTQRFNKDGQVVELLEACTHRPDGSVVRPEARAISEVSAPEVGTAMAYTNAMLKVVSFPALEPGAVIEYRVKVKPRKSKKEDGFSGSAVFGGFYPALKREYRLVVPKDVRFNYAWSRTGSAPTVESLGNQVAYTWTASNTPQIFREAAMPPIEKLVPVLAYSSFRDWQQVATRLRKEFDKGRVASPEVKRVSDSLASGLSRAEAARAIYLFVTRQLRGIRLGFGQAGFETHKSADILAWRYGDCRDKNRLLICLLNAQGIPATPLALSRRAAVPAGVPSPEAFDWLATWATVDGQELLLDPSAEYRIYGSLPDDITGVDALFLDSTTVGLSRTPVSGMDRIELAVTTADIRLEPNGDVSGTVATVTDGCFDEALREGWRDATPTDRRRAMAQTASSIKTGAQIDTFWFSNLDDLTEPALAEFHFVAPRYAVSQQGELSMRVPTPAVVGEALFGITSSSRRTNPVETKPPRTYTYRCNVRLPRGVKVDILPESVAVSGAGVAAEGGWSKTAEGVSFSYTIRLLKSEYPLADFPKLKAAADAVSRPQLREVYFLK